MALFARYEPRDVRVSRHTLPHAIRFRPAGHGDALGIATLIAEREGGAMPRYLEKITSELRRPDLGRQRFLCVAQVVVGGAKIAAEADAACGEGVVDAGGAGGAGDVVDEVAGEVVGFGRVVYCVPDADEPANAAPAGWYLGGVVVAPSHRRRGIARELTDRRLQWLRGRGATEAWYVVNADNRASIDLHAQFGFVEVTRDFVQRGVRFSGRGEGILSRAALPPRGG